MSESRLVQTLESRCLFNAAIETVLLNGTLTVYGTTGSDQIVVDTASDADEVIVSTEGLTLAAVNRLDVSRILVATGDGSDVVTLVGRYADSNRFSDAVIDADLSHDRVVVIIDSDNNDQGGGEDPISTLLGLDADELVATLADRSPPSFLGLSDGAAFTLLNDIRVDHGLGITELVHLLNTDTGTNPQDFLAHAVAYSTTRPSTQPVQPNDPAKNAKEMAQYWLVLLLANHRFSEAFDFARAASSAGWDGAAGQFSTEFGGAITQKFADGDSEAVDNAARHMAWQAYLAYHFGSLAASVVGGINEEKYGDENPPGNPDREADLKNNELGRQIGEALRGQNLTEEEVKEAIRQAVEAAIRNGQAYRQNPQDGNNPLRLEPTARP